MMNSVKIMMSRFSEYISTMPPFIPAQHAIIQGTGNPIRISNTLLPIELDTAISPNPRLATARLLRASGILVPPANRVNPMMASGMESVKPISTAIHTMA